MNDSQLPEPSAAAMRTALHRPMTSLRCGLGVLGIGLAGMLSGCRGGSFALGLSDAPGDVCHGPATSMVTVPPMEPARTNPIVVEAPPVLEPVRSVEPIATAPPAATVEQLAALQQSLEALRQQQAEVLRSLQQIQTADGHRDARLVAIETHVASQSAAMVDLRKNISDQQREQWRALDVLSEGLDEILRDQPESASGGVARGHRRPTAVHAAGHQASQGKVSP